MKNRLVIELTDRKALDFVRELETLRLIKVVEVSITPESLQTLSEKYWGCIDEESAASLRNHIKELRAEWEPI